MQSKEKIEWDVAETIPVLIYRYTDNFTLMFVYIRSIKSSDAKTMGCILGWSFLLYISKVASRHNCSSKFGKSCSRFAFAFTVKMVFDVH